MAALLLATTTMVPATCQCWFASALLLACAWRGRTTAFMCSPITEQSSPRFATFWPSSSSNNLDVQVYDNVFSPEACDVINDLAIDHSFRSTNCDGSSIFNRPPADGVILTPLELAIDSALSALNDTSRVVEYWSREEYLNIDTHADIDEGALEDEGQIRCPKAGHVLYLQVDEGVRGPTFVFDKMGGWNREESEESDKGATEMVTVPCVPGRILRFDGRAMHAVPRPFDRYLLSDKEEKILRAEEEDEFYDDDDFSDDDEIEDDYDQCLDDDDDDDELRSVLLFNTWSDGPPPRFVDADFASGAMPLGIEIDTTDETRDIVNSSDDNIAGGGENGGDCNTSMLCNSIHEWKRVAIMTSSDGASWDGDNDCTGTPVNVNLMGNEQRRCYPKRRAPLRLHLPAQAFKDAVSDARQPTLFVLSNDKR